MADKKAEVMGCVDLLAYLKENPPREEVAVTVEFGDGKAAVFHFQRLFLAFERYIRDITEVDGDGKRRVSPLTSNSTFLLDSVRKEEREALAAFMNAYPANIGDLALLLGGLYSSTAEVTVKNGSKPAGQR